MSLKLKNTRLAILFLIFFSVSDCLISALSSSIPSVPRQEQNIEKADKITLKEDSLQKDNYIIGPGDILELRLFDAPEFSGDYKVLNDGSINLPLIGNFYLNNLTLKNASDLIEAKYGNQLLRPELYLTVKNPRPIIVSVLGEIKRPGIYSLTNEEITKLEQDNSLSNKGLPRIVDAIQKAGGITQSANLKKVTISRRLPGIRKEYKETSIDLLDLILFGNHSQNLFLFDGDVIKIEKTNEITKESMEIAQANLSPKTININIIGQVNRPGRMEVIANTPLNQAVLLAGGPIAWKASKGNVDLIRVNRNGSVTKRKYTINLSDSVSIEKNPPLKDQDIVKVNPSFLQTTSTGLGAIADPISPIITGLSLLKLLGN